jgi:hypothetical protein
LTCWLLQLRSDNILELASLYLLIATFTTGLLTSVTRDSDITVWTGLLTAANAAFLVIALVLGLSVQVRKLRRCCSSKGAASSYEDGSLGFINARRE